MSGPTIQITIPPMGWGWWLVGSLLAWNLFELRHQAAMYGRARDSMEVLIQKGTAIWIAPEPKVSRPPADTVQRRPKFKSGVEQSGSSPGS